MPLDAANEGKGKPGAPRRFPQAQPGGLAKRPEASSDRLLGPLFPARHHPFDCGQVQTLDDAHPGDISDAFHLRGAEEAILAVAALGMQQALALPLANRRFAYARNAGDLRDFEHTWTLTLRCRAAGTENLPLHLES